MIDTYAYADGYGRWHVLTRDTPHGLTRAIERMTTEIHQRLGGCWLDVQDSVNLTITSLPLSEWNDSLAFGGVPVPDGAWLHFAEYGID